MTASLQEAWDYLDKLGGHPTAEPYRQHGPAAAGAAPEPAEAPGIAAAGAEGAHPGLRQAGRRGRPAGSGPGLGPRLAAVQAVPGGQQAAAVHQAGPRAGEGGHGGERDVHRQRDAAPAQLVPRRPGAPFAAGPASGSTSTASSSRRLQEPCQRSRWSRRGEAGPGPRPGMVVARNMRKRVELAEARVPLIQALLAIPETPTTPRSNGASWRSGTTPFWATATKPTLGARSTSGSNRPRRWSSRSSRPWRPATCGSRTAAGRRRPCRASPAAATGPGRAGGPRPDPASGAGQTPGPDQRAARQPADANSPTCSTPRWSRRSAASPGITSRWSASGWSPRSCRWPRIGLAADPATAFNGTSSRACSSGLGRRRGSATSAAW